MNSNFTTAQRNSKIRLHLLLLFLLIHFQMAATEHLSNPVSASFIEVLDTVPPSANLSTNSLTVEGAFVVNVIFSEEVMALEMDGFEIDNGWIETIDGSGSTFSLKIVPITGGNVAVKLLADVTTDIDGNGNLASGLLNVNFIDQEKPQVELTTDLEWVDSIFEVQVHFSEPIIGLEISDFNVSNGAAIELTGSGMDYKININPGAIGAIAVFLAADRVSDGSGNPNLISNFLTVNFAPLDVEAPNVELMTNGNEVHGAFSVDISFNEPVDGMTLEDFELMNATVSDLLGNGMEYTALVTPIEEGEVRLRIPEAAALDNAGNENEASNELILNYSIVDNIAPTVLLSTTNPVINGEFQVKIKFSEVVNGLDKTDFEISNGVANHLAGSEMEYVLSISPTDMGAVWISLPAGSSEDGSGNGNVLSNELQVEYVDGIRPTAILNTPNFNVETAFEVSITFSEPISGLSIEDFYVINGWATNLEEDGLTFTLSVVPDLEGNIVVSLPADMVFDDNGNGNTASNAIAVFFMGNPGEQLNLNLIQEENHLIIGWSTNTEFKNDFFILERSFDGVEFLPIHTRKSNTFGTQLTRYTYDDLIPQVGLNYYRVKQVFEDGSYVYSQTVNIIYKSATPDILVFPNPASRHIFLNTVQFQGKRCRIILYNSLGQVFYDEIFEALPEYAIKLDISHFEDGMYGVQFRVKEVDKFDYKFLIMRGF